MNERFRQLRKCLELSQEEFAKRIGIGKTAVSKIESGENNPSEQTIMLICSNFAVNEIWLRTGEGEMFHPISRREQIARFAGELMREPEDSFRLRLIDALSRLSVEEWEVLRKIAEEMAGGKS